MNGLSYPAISRACASEYQVFQISPHTPASFLTPQQPTARDTVRPFRAARRRDFHPFTHSRVTPVTWRPVSVSPNFIPRRFERIGSKEGISPSSALRSMASPITGTTLQRLLLNDWRSKRSEVRERVWGWQPRHIQRSVWTADPFTDRMVMLTESMKIPIRARVIGESLRLWNGRYLLPRRFYICLCRIAFH
jgi:hypothetical protein